jgi:tetratricopeptide (TPR) repeat protein
MNKFSNLADCKKNLHYKPISLNRIQTNILFISLLVIFCSSFRGYGQKTASEFMNLGLSRYYAQDYEAAIENYTKAIQLKSDFANAYYFRAKANDKLLQFKQAIDDLTQAIKIKPDFGEAYFQRGSLYERINKKDLACQDWSQASAHGYYEANYVLKQKCTPKKKTNEDDY